MELLILRCGRCGKFCDNTGRIFKATKQLICADEVTGFDDSLGECSSCRGPSLDDINKEQALSDELAAIRAGVNRKLSTGNYEA